MDLMEAVFVLARRWTITIPLLVLTIAAVTAGYLLLPWTYESSGTVVFLTSRQIAEKNTGGNPYLAFDGSLSITAELVGRAVDDELTAQDLAQHGLTGTYETQIPPDSRAPLLKVTVTHSDPAMAQATMEAILKRIPAALDDLQKTNSSISQVRLSVLTKSKKPERVVTSKIRSLVGVLAVGLMLTVGAPLIIESIKNPRRPIQPKRVPDPNGGLAPKRLRLDDDAPTAVHVWPPAAAAPARPPASGNPPEPARPRRDGQGSSRSRTRGTRRTPRANPDGNPNAAGDRNDTAWPRETDDGRNTRRYP
ncbi:hypothetical protein [Microbispora sp. H10670]|uniref:hypothetical protein n=1 Tax=Microbispora sp. H10670 TaxID=2729108 RepID=UPI0016017853|nr:hypothetical protein [Microbispora sp. H10670]